MAKKPKSRAAAQPITVALAGDVMLGRLMNAVIGIRGPQYPWGDTVDLLRGADLSIINLECVIAAGGQPWTRTPKVFHFRANPEAIKCLDFADINCVTLANNHSLDYREEGLFEMLKRLNKGGIEYAGAGKNLAEAESPAWLVAKDKLVAVISFTDNEPGWAATANAAGTNYVPVDTTTPQFGRLKASVQHARQVGADVVVAAAHWGPNMRQTPLPSFVSFAHELIDAGADIFVGHSAHILQGIEIYRGKPILYDCGDFVDDYAVDEQLRNDQSALFWITVGAGGSVDRIDIYPVLIKNFQANLAQGSDFREIADRLTNLCSEMGTRVATFGRQLRVDIAAERGKLAA